MRRLLLILLPLLALCLFYEVDDAAACIGGIPTSLLNAAPHNEIVVFGTIVESSAGNAIIDVHSYLLGEGEQYLLIYQEPPRDWIANTIRFYDFGCNVPMIPFSVGQQIYIGLDRNADGSYSADKYGSHYFVEHVQRIENHQSVVNYQHYDGEIAEGEDLN